MDLGIAHGNPGISRFYVALLKFFEIQNFESDKNTNLAKIFGKIVREFILKSVSKEQLLSGHATPNTRSNICVRVCGWIYMDNMHHNSTIRYNRLNFYS